MTVRAVQIDRFGGPEVLEVREVSAPSPGPGELLIRSVATSINPIDGKLRMNDRNLGLPLTLGWDLAGVVVESREPSYHVGDRVVAMSHVVKTGRGTWSDLVALPAADVAHAPTTCSLTEAAALPLAGLTALQAWDGADVPHNGRALVVGAAGAVGGHYLQLAANAGVRVDGLVSRAEHVEPVRKLGGTLVSADHGELPNGVYDVIFDTVGLPQSGIDPVRLLTAQGRYITSLSHADLSTIPNGSKVLVQQHPDGLAALARKVDEGALQLRVAAYYPVQQVVEAHQQFESGGLLGKVVVMF
jgi:NADPH:quinone reductase-like Zn-dependent oxidoreductase